MKVQDVTEAITALGLGSGIGAIVTSLIASRSGKGKARAEAADLLVNAAERVGKMNEGLDADVRRLRGMTDDLNRAMYDYLDDAITKQELMERVKEIRNR